MAQTFTLEKFNEKAEHLKPVKIFQIEKGIPMPQPKSDSFAAQVVETVKNMEVGDSFVIEHRVSGYIYQVIRKKLSHFKMVSKTTEDGKLRIWRAE